MKVHKQRFERWQKFVSLRLRELGKTEADIDTPAKAWDLAHELSIPREAYHVDSAIYDTHIETAMRRIFPKAWEKKR